MKKIYTAIIMDDEPTSISNLHASLEKTNRIEIVDIASNVQKGKGAILADRPDLLFLDVEMPDKTGIEFLREMRGTIKWPMQVIFYTAYEKYLLDALRESAFDYLLKPYTENEFSLVINRFLDYMKKEAKPNAFEEAIKRLQPKQSSYYLISTINGFQSVQLEDIGYFEYDQEKKYWFAIFADQTVQLRQGTTVENILKFSSVFTQINPQQIINISYLLAIENKRCILSHPFERADRLIISRFYFKSVQEHFFLI